MKGYYFVGTYLPDLDPDLKPDIEFEEVIELFQDNLTPADLKNVNRLRLLIDIENLKLFWQEKSLDPRGAFDHAEIEEALLARGRFPAWVDDFLDEFNTTEERLKHFPKLWSLYFQHEIPKSSGFLRDYLEFERGLKLTAAGFRAKKMGRDLSVELQYEDPFDTLVQQILAQKDAKSYVPPSQFEDLTPIFEEYGDEPSELNKALIRYRFRKIEELLGLQTLTLDSLIGYMAELFLIEHMQGDKEAGEKIINTIVSKKDSNE